ncbi:transporter [Salinimonas lutimaris]|uniref:transporter n=1 Tax=Salinimonas lutimaris TaxID=914153 RepID=UPI001E4E6363|nr:transporter [Salinimonas lutimaris]
MRSLSFSLPALVASVCSGVVCAQSTPSEFAELSFQDLLDVDIQESSREQTGNWRMALQFKAVEFDGYMQGDSDLSLDEVLFTPGEEARTQSNFPVLPTVIDQFATIANLSYQYDWGLTVGVQLPFIRQLTDHISVVPGYDHFLISSDGIGDVVVNARWLAYATPEYRVWLGGGLSLPTGSIDETGDTPRAPGEQQLPYTMQIGSGTYDFPLEVSWQTLGAHSFTIALSAMIRSGTNDRHYRLGNNYEVSSRYRFQVSPVVGLQAGMDYRHTDAIHGQDDEITVPGNFAYPASITNPALYGGDKVSLMAGLSTQLGGGMTLSVDFSKPVYQHLNGPQPKEVWRAGIQLATMF